jgi:hypothetical protein
MVQNASLNSRNNKHQWLGTTRKNIMNCGSLGNLQQQILK